MYNYILLFLYLISINLYAKANLIKTKESSTLQMQQAGDGSSIVIGGSDVINTKKLSSWFYGNKEIEVCYFYTKSFILKEALASKMLSSALKKWRNYISYNSNNATATRWHQIKY